MHNNYYFLRQLVPALEQRLAGKQLLEAFSQNRDELVLTFADPNEPRDTYYIKAYLDARFCCLQFPEHFYRAKKNSVDLFAETVGAQFQRAHTFENERSFMLQLQQDSGMSYQLLFKMHGNRANVVLFREHTLVTLFKSSLRNDATLALDALDRSLDVTYEHFEQVGGQASKLYPTLGKVPKQYLQSQGYSDLPRSEQWTLLRETIDRLSPPTRFYLVRLDGAWHLSLLEFGEVASSYSDPIAAINAFFLTYIKDERLSTLQRQVGQRLAKEEKQTEGYLRKTRQRLQQFTTGPSYQQTADIIMANLHAIPTGAGQATLYDFYHQQEVDVKLNPKLSPQKVAENYYRKAKNQRIEVAQAEENIARSEARLLSLMEHQEALATIDTPSELQAYAEAHHLLQKNTTQAAPLPYRRTSIEGYDVLIGKSAKSNDDLLRQHTQKDDLWLHAKDVSGSHVIVKQRGNQAFPVTVIEQAAQLAAYYSKRQHDSLAPVIYTPRKYVRKGKNMPAGAVRVEREEVVLVAPKGLS